jgi:GWxTD domain-containing protein
MFRQATKTKILIASTIALFAIVACKPYIQVASENIAGSYAEDFTPLLIEPSTVHLNDSESIFTFKLSPEQFLYLREKSGEPFKASVSVRLLIFDSFNTDKWSDSSSFHHSFEKSTINFIKDYSLSFKAYTGNTYAALVSVSDNNKEIKQNYIIGVAKTDRYDANWFVSLNSTSKVGSIRYCQPGDTVLFGYLGNNPEHLKCYFYNDSFDIPSPPFSYENSMNLKLKEDSLLAVSKTTKESEFQFITDKKGIYFVSADENMQSGFTIFAIDSGFPEIATHSDMLGPMRYITSQKEFLRIAQSENIQAAIEEFWLKIGSHEENARNLIKKFYTRVVIANRMFSSYTEGWKTDRGMIYIVFGPPNIVYRGSNQESWIYGEENNFFSITFTFEKLKNKFTNNDYFLQRTPVYKDNWYRAVDIWRQ